MNFRMIKHVLGQILVFETAFLLLPLLVALIYGEWTELFSILGTMGITLGIGALFCYKKPSTPRLYAKEGFVIVSMSWILISAFGALPFVISGAIPNYINALFETVSGFTTTGSSILTDVEALPHSLLIWRSFANWIGGMGVLVFVMAILPLSGAQNMHIMKAESPGPDVSKLVPRVKNTAKILYAIYISLTLVQLILLLCGGMSLFDASNAALATAGTGGFGVKNDSMGSYNSYLQVVCTVFMLLFSINFNSYYLLLKTRFREAFNTEVKVFLGIVLTAIALITANLLGSANSTVSGFWDALKHAAFTVASMISTCGFATVDFDLWPQLSRTILVVLMFVGACAGSTGGGFKVSRLVILSKGASREMQTRLHPRQVKKLTLDGRRLDHELVRTVNAYLVIYFMVFVVSLLLISFDPYAPAVNSATGLTMNEGVTNFTAVASAINNIGPGLDMVGPTANYAFFSPFSKIVLIFDMLAGRLELIPMLLLFSPSTWKK